MRGVFGRSVRVVRVPAPLLNAIAHINLAMARLTGRPAMLTPPKLRELRHEDWTTDNAAISEATGWVPGTTACSWVRTVIPGFVFTPGIPNARAVIPMWRLCGSRMAASMLSFKSRL